MVLQVVGSIGREEVRSIRIGTYAECGYGVGRNQGSDRHISRGIESRWKEMPKRDIIDLIPET